MLKALIAGSALALLLTAPAFAQTLVSGYVKKDGTYVAPYYRSSPNSTTSDNYSTKGNVNPYTGAAGTKADTKPAYSAPLYTPPATTSTYGSSYGSTSSSSSSYGVSTYGSSYGSSTATKPATTSTYGSSYGY